MTDYERICDFQNLYQAHLNARKGKRHKREVIRFEMDLAKNLSNLQDALLDRSYQIQGYYQFQVHEPKTRDIYATYYPDRVVLHCLCGEVLIPALQKRVIYDNVACQPGKGTHFGIARLNKFLRAHYKEHGTQGYFLKCDISKYFASLDHEVIKDQMSRAVKDRGVRRILHGCVDSFSTPGRPGKGAPLGNQTSQWFGVFYLDPIDRFIKEVLRVKHYIRYMDDFLLLHHDKAFLQDALVQIRQLLARRCKLELNNRTQITPLSAGVEFLGWRFYLTETGKVVRKLKPQSKQRYKRKIWELQSRYTVGKMGWDKVENVLASFDGHLRYGHAYQLKSHTMKDFVQKRDPNEAK
ncbi:MAG: RNA-directed DNA polymerase [Oscillospiraceae bacterium]|nr:RNA-directed DNA polymerase [Oscillospiraceae bacterium]